VSTRAIQFLEQNGVPFEVVKYRHDEKGAEFAAKTIGFPLEQTVKTLVVDLGGKRFLIALMPGNKQLALKRLSKLFSVKRAAMADTPTAQRLTGYLVGGISPFGINHPLPAAMDEGLLAFEKVMINAGQRGMMLVMAPKVIADVLSCTVSKLSKLDKEKI